MNYKDIKTFCNGGTIRTIVVYHHRENEMPSAGKARMFDEPRNMYLQGTRLVFGPHYSEYGLQKDDRAEVDGDLLSIFNAAGNKIVTYQKLPA